MITEHLDRCQYLTFPHLDAIPGLAHAVFTRHGGFSWAPYASLNMASSTGDSPDVVRQNRAVAAAVMGLPLVAAKPVHGNNVVVVRDADVRALGQETAEVAAALAEHLRAVHADAMVTDGSGFALMWAFGDCAPILLVDPQRHVAGLIHAGWRGAAAGVIPRTVATISDTFGSKPTDLLAGVGPAIGACCYAVSEEVRTAFMANPSIRDSACFATRAGMGNGEDAICLDVGLTVERQLRACGIPGEQIINCHLCTGCRTDQFYSHRREPKPSGRFGVAIGWRDGRAEALS